MQKTHVFTYLNGVRVALGFRVMSKPGMWPSLDPLFGRNAPFRKARGPICETGPPFFLVWPFVLNLKHELLRMRRSL